MLNWLNTHPIIVWLIIIVATLVCLALLWSTIRLAYRYSRELQQDEQERQETKREAKVFLVNAWRTIRQAEEWEVDVTELRQSVDTFKALSTIQRIFERQQYRVSLACGVFVLMMIVSAVLLWVFPQANLAALVVSVITVLPLVWIGFEGVRYWRIRRYWAPVVKELALRGKSKG